MRAFIMTDSRRCVAVTATAVGLMLLAQTATAGLLRERLQERRAARSQQAQLEDGVGHAKTSLPAGVTVVRDVRYGDDARQRYDVYLPPQASHAPVIFMVHGGGWRWGDKSMASVIQNKIEHWLPKGFILISVNYRMLPVANPLQQASDIAAALADAQQRAASWGGDRNRFILMGHSAGAHLVSLLAATPALASKQGATQWLGTIALDSAALDVERIMNERHLPLYDHAFGDDAVFWRAVSPYHQLNMIGAPFLAVCSTQRKESCSQARRFAAKAETIGMRASVLEQDLSHKQINQQLGQNSAYTEAVDAFIGTLDSSLGRMLQSRSEQE